MKKQSKQNTSLWNFRQIIGQEQARKLEKFKLSLKEKKEKV